MNNCGTMNRTQMMSRIYETGFTIDDILLYLDTHPCDKNALEYYENQKKLYNRLSAEYAEHFGPLLINHVDAENGWSWVKTPWPWEMEGC